MSAKTRLIKIQSSTDRKYGTLSSFVIDLTDVSHLQNVKSAQLVSCGFTLLQPNVSDIEPNLVLEMEELRVVFPENVPDFTVIVDDSQGQVGSYDIPAPPAGIYTGDEWATTIGDLITTTIAAPGLALGLTYTENPAELS
jgi:hypothetical protein